MEMNENWIKVALEVKKETQLKVLNIGLEVEDILRGICEENGIHYKRGVLSLRVKDMCKITGTEYVTDENKHELKHGGQLKLSKSPAERIESLIDRLHKSNNTESSLKNLKALAMASKDSVILKQMDKQNTAQNLRVFASVRNLTQDEYYRLYQIFGELLAKDYLSQLCEDEVNHLIDMVTQDEKITKELLILAFDLLILLRKKGKLFWPMKYLPKLTPYIRCYGEVKIQEKSVQLVNYLYFFANNADEKKKVHEFMKSSIMITYINKYIIREHLSDKMKHQLYLYQKIILRKYNVQLETVDVKEQKILENLDYVVSNIGVVNQVLRSSAEVVERRASEGREGHIALQIFRNLRISMPPVGRQRSSSNPNSPEPDDGGLSRKRYLSQGDNDIILQRIEKRREFLREMSIESVRTIDSDLSEGNQTDVLKRTERTSIWGDVPALARDNLYYFIINDFRGFQELMLLHRNQLQSMLHLSVGITNLLCRIFEIQDKEPEIKKGTFVPLSFLYFDYFIERMFSLTLKLFHQTRQEMNVTIDSSEYPLVARTVEDQLSMALECEPVEFEQLERKLSALNVKAVIQMREASIADDIERQLKQEPAFLELKKIVTPRILSIIQQKRLQFMESGEHVPQFDYKGQRITGKKWYIVLTKSHTNLLVEECSSHPCKNQHKLLETICVSSIKEIEYGSKSNFYKEVYYNLCSERDMFFRTGVRLQEPELKFPISIQLQTMNYIDFCAGNSLALDYWVDGLHYLIGELKSEYIL